MRRHLERNWDRANTYARSGNFGAAVAMYESILRDDPRQPAAWLALSDLGIRRQRYRDAVVAARSAAQALHGGGQPGLLAGIVLRLLSLGESLPAIEAIRAADWAHPQVLRHAAGLAQYLGLADQHALALEVIEFASARVPENAELVYAHANTLRHLGRMADATRAYERCIALAPDHAEAHWSLAYHAPSTPPGARVERLRHAVAALADDAPAAPYLYYALFKELDHAGDTGAAWQALQHGARCKRRSIDHDARREAARYQQMQALCGPEFFQQPVDVSADHVPIFIVGLPRSGTTLLERILGNAAGVRSAGELGDFHMQLCWETNRFASEILDAALLQAVPGIDFQKLGQGYLDRTAWRADGARFLVDKFPANFAYAGLIHKAIPQARIICMRREPMDSCFSNLKELFAQSTYPYSYDLDELADHILRFEALLEHWNRAMPGALHTVHYEDLVRQPEQTLREVSAYCGIAFDPRCLDIEGNRAPSATASSSQVREPIHVRNLHAWERYRAPLERARARLQPDPSRILGR